MRDSHSWKVALALWAAFAVVTWNVVFDRHVYVAAVQFTQQQIQRHERGEQVSSIAEAFTPQLGHAAARATLWGGVVLVTGVLLTVLAGRPTRKT
jgi:hypothetical protein